MDLSPGARANSKMMLQAPRWAVSALDCAKQLRMRSPRLREEGGGYTFHALARTLRSRGGRNKGARRLAGQLPHSAGRLARVYSAAVSSGTKQKSVSQNYSERNRTIRRIETSHQDCK